MTIAVVAGRETSRGGVGREEAGIKTTEAVKQGPETRKRKAGKTSKSLQRGNSRPAQLLI
eukprot:6193958-Pleurochrysis_carterae.AAC.2